MNSKLFENIDKSKFGSTTATRMTLEPLKFFNNDISKDMSQTPNSTFQNPLITDIPSKMFDTNHFS